MKIRPGTEALDLVDPKNPAFLPEQAGTYSFKLVVKDNHGHPSNDLSSPNNVVTVIVDWGPPTSPQLTAPIGGIYDPTPLFTWNTVPGGDQYEIRVDNLTTGQLQVIRKTDVTGSSWESTTSLTPGHSYRAWVKGISVFGGAGPWSPPVDFNIRVLGTPTLLEPSGSILSLTPVFKWSAVADAEEYDLWVDNLTTGQSQVIRVTMGGNTEYTAISNQLQFANTYRWWVRAQRTDGAIGSWSAAMDFSITPGQLPVAVADVQSPGATVETGTVVTLTGSVSYDPDNLPSGGIQSYTWTQEAGPAVTLDLNDPVHPVFTPTQVGTYTFLLVVNDGANDSTDASSPNNRVTITVQDTITPTVDTTSVILNGSVDDPAATITVNDSPVTNNSGSWQTEVTLTGATTTVTVKATDSAGSTTTETVTITK